MHRGKLINVAESTPTISNDSKFPCVKCKSLFKTKGAQRMHEKWCKQEVASENKFCSATHLKKVKNILELL